MGARNVRYITLQTLERSQKGPKKEHLTLEKYNRVLVHAFQLVLVST